MMTNQLTHQFKKIIKSTAGDKITKKQFIKRLKKSRFTRDEDPLTHLCVYFAAYDPQNHEVFIGHHKKSGLWLFNGGHIDKGELPHEAAYREISEEWGIHIKPQEIKHPQLLTLTKIEHPEKITCQWHYDIWYFIPLDKKLFSPDQKLLAKEFHQIGWKTIEEAKHLTSDASTNTALQMIYKLSLF